MTWTLLSLAYVVAACQPLIALTLADDDATATQPEPAVDDTRKSAASEPPGIRTYMPGIRIDWSAKEVLLDAQIVLRQGPLELVACTPGTKEHESILVTRARPLHVHQAMGLIGLEPGKPVRFDEKADQWLPPSGQRLDVLIRYEDNGRPREVAAEEWLLDVKNDKPPGAIAWVFAGSMTNSEGEFAADIEGTVITVVDFPTAVIAPAALHTSDDSQLWLRANKDAIPPVKTPGTIVIRAARAASKPSEPPRVENPGKPGDNPSPHGHPDKDPG